MEGGQSAPQPLPHWFGFAESHTVLKGLDNGPFSGTDDGLANPLRSPPPALDVPTALRARDCGVILLRPRLRSPQFLNDFLVTVLTNPMDWHGHFAVAQEGSIRIVPLPR